MKDYLWEFCSNLNIDVAYIDHTSTILSSGFINNTPTIHIHKIFKNCPQMVADAIIDMYIKFDSAIKNKRIIQDYATDMLTTVEYKIEPPDDKFISFVRKYILPSQPTKKGRQKPKAGDPSSDMIEMHISSITKKDFWGNASMINPEDGITASDENLMELDIVIDNPDT